MTGQLQRSAYTLNTDSFGAYEWNGTLVGAQPIPGLIMLRSASPLAANTPRVVSLSSLDFDLMPTALMCEGVTDTIVITVTVQQLLPAPTNVITFFVRNNNFVFPRCVLPKGCQIILNPNIAIPSLYLFCERADLLHIGTF